MKAHRLAKAALIAGVLGIVAEVAKLQHNSGLGIIGAILIAAGIIATAINESRSPTAPQRASKG